MGLFNVTRHSKKPNISSNVVSEEMLERIAALLNEGCFVSVTHGANGTELRVLGKEDVKGDLYLKVPAAVSSINLIKKVAIHELSGRALGCAYANRKRLA